MGVCFGDAGNGQRQSREKASQCLLLLAGHGLTGATTGAGIGAGALSAHGQAHAVTATTQAADVLQALHGHAFLTAQVAFEGEGFSGRPQFLNISVAEVLDAGVWIHACGGKNLLGTGQADAIDVGEGDFHTLFAGDINTGNPSH